MAADNAPPLTVLKLGGSLASDGARLRRVLAGLADEFAPGTLAIVPGGGAFADVVRVSQSAVGFSDALAHRLALAAMGRMAEVFSEIAPELIIAGSLEAITGLLRRGRRPVWDPVALRSGHPQIPESWDVTSDSLALWLATVLGAERCVLVKSLAPPPGASPADLARLGVVDAAFPRFATSYPGSIVVRGPEADRPRAAA